MATSFPESSLVWVPDATAKFVPARVLAVFAQGEPARVSLVDDTGKTSIFEIELDPSVTQTLTKMDEESLGESKADMIDLKELNDASILHNLRGRFLRDEIYTSIGDILLAINPFKLLPIYTPIYVDRYIRPQQQQQPQQQQPHIFKTADEAFVRLISNKRDQACMVTGESGAGKTETTKLFLQFLAEVSSSWSHHHHQQQQNRTETVGGNKFQLSDRILRSNPLLESFGNAVTRKNHNSSRFGKMICVNIDHQTGEIASAKTTIFLLEKSRLPIQDVGERNFHIFYQLCAAARSNADIQRQYQVLDADECRYLGFNKAAVRQNDLVGFEAVQRSMQVLNFSAEVQSEIFRIVSAVLHLGNLEFCQDESIHNCEASRITPQSLQSLQCAAQLLGLQDVGILHANLCSKSVQAGGKDSVQQPQSLEKSRKSRDALAIHLYSSLFEFVTHEVNKQQNSAEATGASKTNAIAILDIFGFEAFDGPHNSFEQLCINYCNEKLQQTFNDVVFSRERLLYEQEEVTKAVDFAEMLANTHKYTLGVLELFERPRLGLFALLDEESSVPGGTDFSFLKKLNNEYREKIQLYHTGKKNLVDTTFTIKHYVGPVVYQVKNFLEKNDGGFLTKDLHGLCLTSQLSILRATTTATTTASMPVFTGKQHLASQFANQLDALVKELGEMEPSFVRCIKPNAEFLPSTFNAGMVLDQLHCAGVMEVCRIRQLGFPVRRTFAEFASRYGALTTSLKRNGTAVNEQLVRKMLHELKITSNFACGKSRVFMKNACFADLEHRLAAFKTLRVIRIQRQVRGHITRRKYRALKQALAALARGMRAKSVEEIHEGLDQVRKWSTEDGGKYLPQVQAAWKLLSEMEELRWGVNLISRSIASKDTNQIRSAMACTTTIVPPDHEILLQAREALVALEERDEFIAKLNEIISSTSSNDANAAVVVEELTRLLALAPKYDAEGDATTLLDKARAKLARLEQDAAKQVKESSAQTMLDALRLAMARRDAKLIAHALIPLFANGMDLHPEAQAAMALERELESEMQRHAQFEQMEQVLEMKKENVSDADLVLVEGIGRKSSTLKLKADRVVREATDKKEAQAAMLAVLELGENAEFAAVRAALERAYAAGFKQGETLYQVQKLMRSKNRARRLAKKHRVVIDVQGPVPEKLSKQVGKLRDETKLERDGGEALIAESRESERYLFANYYSVREPDDAALRTRVRWMGNQVLDKSILETSPEGVGEMISKLILGYTGERSAAFPATCASSLLEMGQANSDVGDEIYIQICAHLTGNMSSESATRTWQLLCLAIASFYPSADMLFFVVRFLIDRAEGRTDAALPALAEPRPKLSTTLDTYTLEQRYAWYALKRLQRDLTNEVVVTDHLPSLEEICAFGERVPLVTNITYPDGSLLMEDMIISPLHTCQDVVALCLKQSGIHQVEMGPSYGLFARPVDRAQLLSIPLQKAAAAVQEEVDVNPQKQQQEDRASPNRFRLSITAVFKAGGNFLISRRDSASSSALRRASTATAPAAPATSLQSKPSLNIRRTDEELDWDVPLLPSDYVSDVLLKYLRDGRGAPRLVFKKRIFVPEFEKLAEDLRQQDAESEENVSTSEAMARIEFFQAVDDFSTGALPFDKEDDVVDLVACRVALKFDNRLPANDAERLMQVGQVELLIPATWKNKKTEINWARALLEKKGRVNGRETKQLQDMVLKKCQARPLFGMQLFRVQMNKDKSTILACSKRGFTQISAKEYKTLSEYRFEDMASYTAPKPTTLVIKLKKSAGEDHLVFYSPHAREIVEIASEYESVANVLNALNPDVIAAKEAAAAVEASPQPQQPQHPPTPSQMMLHPPGSTPTARKVTAYRASVDEAAGGVASEIAAGFGNNHHSIREQMEKLGATETDINKVLRVGTGNNQVPPPPNQVDKLRTPQPNVKH